MGKAADHPVKVVPQRQSSKNLGNLETWTFMTPFEGYFPSRIDRSELYSEKDADLDSCAVTTLATMEGDWYKSRSTCCSQKLAACAQRAK